jgi:hypothetical protein
VVLLSASYTFFAYVVFGSQQSENTVLPFGDVNPAGHAVQNNAPLAEYVLAGQTPHAALPFAFLNVPAAHATHGPPFGPVYRALQTQAVIFVLVDGKFELLGHAVHAAVLTVSLYVPTPQAVHGPPAGPVYPLLHA